MRYRTVVAVLGLCGLLGTAAGAVAAQVVTVTQKGRTFSAKEVTIKEGDTILFVNDDGELLHHVYAKAPDFAFDSGEQASNTRVPVRFTRKGTFRVRCDIHPRMAMDVVVE